MVMLIPMKIPNIANAITIRVSSPDGEIFVHCTEDAHGNLAHVIINIGKAGNQVHAWADALSRMINIALETKTVRDILIELSNIKSTKAIRTSNGIYVHSGPEAVFYALMLYEQAKRRPTNSTRKRKLTFLRLK